MRCATLSQPDVSNWDSTSKASARFWGHASVNITLNRYVHPSMELKRDKMEKLSGLIAE